MGVRKMNTLNRELGKYKKNRRLLRHDGLADGNFLSLLMALTWVFLHQIKNQSTMIKKEVIAGDTFPIVYKYKQPDGTIANMPEGYDFMIGLRQKGSQTATTFSYLKGDIAQDGTGTYRWEISHELSKSLNGDIMVELVVYNRDGSFVKHCIEPIMLTVLPSFMNEHLDIEE